MRGQIDTIKIIILPPSHYLISRFIAIPAEEEHFIRLIRWTRSGKKAWRDRIALENNFFPLVCSIIIPKETIMIGIGAISTKQVHLVLPGVIEYIMVVQLRRQIDLADSIP